MSLYDDPDAPLPSTSNGLGSLADELGDLLGSTGDYDDSSDLDGGYSYDHDYDYDDSFNRHSHNSDGGDDDDDLDDRYSDLHSVRSTASTNPTTPASPRVKRHSRQRSSLCGGGGGGRGEEWLVPEDEIPPGLERQLKEIEGLALRSRVEMRDEEESARRGIGGLDGGDGSGERGMLSEVGTIKRLQEGLQTLAPQSGMESGTQRLMNTHSALSTHLLTTTTHLRDLTFTLTPHSLPSSETSDLLLSLLPLIPRPSLLPLTELTALRTLTDELLDQLSILGDSLHMARQSSITASRRLRLAKEAAAEWRGEVEMVEKARNWIEEGGWEGRLQKREAAGVCSEVLKGFGETCGKMEEKLRGLVTA
ncbi:hypothetical protein EX30DRAFT_340481 [Ascodesmis nigricans]|uniref:Uncharacterized protein n=1 Tax=Ascodesmis nigricans TaxID=341454 RepID=A0A4S2MY54_9PEZI|nr:hypothetical protein EX30DRAFT_340481 [Ascodesmis nigricans]